MSAVRFDESLLTRWPSVRTWREDSDEIVQQLVERWALTVEREFSGGVAGRAFAVRAGGLDAVLKVGFPHPEAVAEAIALEAWSPRYAPRVLALDAPSWGVLLDRVSPGTPLTPGTDDPDRAVARACRLLGLAHRTPAPPAIPRLSDVIGEWPENARRMIAERSRSERSRLAPWLGLADRLIADDDAGALVHGDANPGNILEGPSDLMLIDPKPMRGRPEFDPAPLLEQVAPFTSSELGRRVGIAADILGADRALIVAWGAVRAALNVAWAWDDGNSGVPELNALAAWEALSAA